MKIIRWLLSHSLFILLIVAVIYCYMFWGNLLGKDTPAGKAVAYLSEEFVEVKEFVNAVKARQAQISEKNTEAQQSSDLSVSGAINNAGAGNAGQKTASIAAKQVIVENTAEIPGEPAEQPVVEPPPMAVAEAAPELAPVAENEQQPAVGKQKEATAEQNTASIAANKTPEQADTVAISQERKITTDNNTRAESTDAVRAAGLVVTNVYPGKKFVPVEVEKHLNNVDEHGEVINVSQPTGTIREIWITARKSFYERNYELSEKNYQLVIDSTKNNFDAYGELGNVYFNQGKDKQAASAYFEAAAILINKGQVSRASSLMGLLRHLDESKATELQKLIDAAQS